MDINEFYVKENEKPLDTLVTDGGFCAMFRTIGCVGDSLSSGEFQILHEGDKYSYHDLYEHSWGQYLARMAGSKVYNFSRGGMTAKEYCESFAEERDFWNPELASQAYIIALGVNDLFGQKQEVGSVDDICAEDYTKNKKTFAGYYAQIIQRLKKISPDAKFFFMTMPEKGRKEDRTEAAEAHAKLLYDMAEFFDNSYVIDLYKYAPAYDEKFREQFFLYGHMNPCGYILTAKMVASYIDYIIRHNMQDFMKAGLIGTGIDKGL